MAEGFQKLESTILCDVKGQSYKTPPGSKSMACNQSSQVNVGDPDRSSINVRHSSMLDIWKYLLTSPTNEEAEKSVRKSDGS